MHGHRIAGVALPFIVNGDQLVNIAQKTGRLDVLARLSRIIGGRADVGIGGVDRADVVIGGDRAAPGIAKLKANRVVNGKRQGAPDVALGIGIGAHHLGALRGADHRGRGGLRAGFGPADAIHRIDEITNRFIKQVNLVRLCRRKPA